MKKIIVAPSEIQKHLLKRIRKNDVFSNVKFFTKEDILRNFTFSYTNDAIVYLIANHHFSYELSQIYLESLVLVPTDYCGENKNILFLSSLQKELIDKKLLIKNDLAEFEFSNCEIEVYCYSKNDFVIQKYLGDKNIKFVDNSSSCVKEVNRFNSVEDEIFYLCNNIAKLIEDGVEPSKIKITNLSSEYDQSLKRSLRNFGINLNGYFEEAMISSHFSRFLFENFGDFYESSSIDEFFANFKDDEHLSEFIDVLKKFRIDNFSIEEQRSLYKEVLSKRKFKSEKFKEAISYIDEPYIDEDEYLFILDFSQSSFPSYKRDDGFLSNDNLSEICAETVSSKNMSLTYQYENSLKQKGNIFLSYSKNLGSRKNLQHPLVEKLHINVISNPTSNIVYSKDEFHLQQANLKDLARKYRQLDLDYYRSIEAEDLEYLTYSYQVDKISHYSFDQVISFSFSSFEKYQKCAYSYYLEKVLRLKSFKTSFISLYGILVHYILEKTVSNPDKTFDELYEEAFTSEKELKELSKKDRFMCDNLKEQVFAMVEFIKKQHSDIFNPSFLVEQKMENVPLDEHLTLNGKIDKIIKFGPSQEYMAIIDYKTGSKSIEEDKVIFGLSNQLPFYSLMIDSNKNEKTKVEYQNMFGYFIQPLTYKSKDCDNSDLKLLGKCVDDDAAINMFDKYIKSESEGKYLRIKTIKNGGFNKNSVLKNSDWFKKMVDVTRKLLLEAKDKVLNNEFLINPKVYKDKNIGCTFCDFKDVCFSDHTAEVVLTNGDEEDGEN